MGCTAGGVDTCTTADEIRVYTNNGTTFNENSTWEQNLSEVGYGSLALGDIDNDGDLDLAVLGDKGGEIGDVKIYLNNGTSFNNDLTWESNLSNVDAYAGSLAFGDIDNDGDLDLALVGASPSSDNGIYINNGTSFVKSNNWLTLPYVGHGLGMGSLAFGDIDNDGDLDLVFLGSYSTNWFDEVYINNGTSLVANSTWESIVPGGWPSLILGDYDNDGDLDLAYIGVTGDGDECRIYGNTGSSFSFIQQAGAYFDGSIAFGDFDNDGDLDIASMGKESGRNRIRTNNNTIFGHNIFEQQDMSDDNMQQGGLAWIDVDGDRNLDLVINGKQGDTSTYLFKIYISNASLTKNNTQPNASNSSFSSSYTNNILTLGWGNGSDNETPTAGLYYNLMIGNSTTNHTIVSGIYGGSSNPTAGYFGNMMQRKNITLNLELEANETYYWYVQTIDTGLAKSNWSEAQNFTTSLDTTKPSVTLNSPSPDASLHTINPVFVFNATITDANLTNVTLYADFNGTMIANETNSSGLNGTYIFTKNISDKNDGMYNWYIYACDGDSNCQTSGRSFYLDRAYPIVNSISPASGSTSSSTSVTFSYNVTDTDIANCSLIIAGSVSNTSSSIVEDTTQTFTNSLSNAVYNWYVNCTDYVGYTNNSISRSLTVSVPSGNGGTTGSGGTTTTFWTAGTHAISDEQFEAGYTKELAIKSRMRVKVENTYHYVGVVNLTNTTATINITSDPVQVVLGIGDDAKIDVLDDGWYDIYVLLNDINESKANLSVQSIHEEIPEGEGPVATTGEEVEGEGKEIEEEEKKKWWLYGLIGVGIVVVIVIFFYLKNHLWKREFKKRRKK